MLRETVEIVKAMWTEPDVTYDGTHFQLDGAQCDPKPVQSPHPQILIGGGGEQLTLRVVARHADASNFGGKPHEFAAKSEVLKGHCAAVGRDYDEIQKTWSPEIFIRETEAEVDRGREPLVLGRARRVVDRGQPRGHTGAGGRRIQEYVDLGCTGFYPWCSDYPETETVRLFAEQVVPQLR